MTFIAGVLAFVALAAFLVSVLSKDKETQAVAQKTMKGAVMVAFLFGYLGRGRGRRYY